MFGKVYLVGAGPGDPGLLTLKAYNCLARADAIVYDRLTLPRMLNFAPAYAAYYDVGKTPGKKNISQKEIGQLLIRLAQEHHTVVRLKGGDPFVFGRGGEEALVLHAAHIPWEVVPGVSSAVSVPAYAGIPVTHRGVSSGFAVVTGHGREMNADVEHLVRSWTSWKNTLVVLMGIEQLPQIVSQLLAADKPATTPVALIHQGTRADQQTLVGTLGDIVDRALAINFKSPAVTIMGEVVNLRESLQWVETRPLFGRHIVVVAELRSRAQQLAEELELLGAEVVDFALEDTIAPSDMPIQVRIDVNLGHLNESPRWHAIRQAVADQQIDGIWVDSPLAYEVLLTTLSDMADSPFAIGVREGMRRDTTGPQATSAAVYAEQMNERMRDG